MKTQRILLFPLFWKCNWHKGDFPMTYDPDPQNGLGIASCPECGSLLDLKTCKRCGRDFLNFDAKGFDDVMGAPMVTSAGDLMCVRCGSQWERDEEESYEEDDYGYGDDYDENTKS